MKKSKKPVIGSILLGVGLIGVVGIPSSDNKLYLVIGIIVLIVAGAILLNIGIKQNRQNADTPAQTKTQPSSSPVYETRPQNFTVNVSTPYSRDEAFKCFLIRVNEYNVLELGEGGLFDVIFDRNKDKFVAYDKSGDRLGDLPSNARESLDESDRYEGKILYFDERNESVRPKVEIYK